MQFDKSKIQDTNSALISHHEKSLNFVKQQVEQLGKNPEEIIQKIADLQVGIPSWALSTGGTRFGRFPGDGEPRSIEEKMEDVGLLHALNQSSGLISLHIPWDTPKDPEALKRLADEIGIGFDAMNSNTFQDQPDQNYSYKFGSVSHVDKSVRQQAIDHNIDVIQQGIKLGSKSMTVWLADGSCFPGQQNFKGALQRTIDSLAEVYEAMPKDWKMYVEYKPYEPAFYSTVIKDWGVSMLIAKKLGSQAYSLVDLGHHLPNTNIEHTVALLLMEGKLGGFHFNDSKYGDDDLTVGSIKPYQLFLIFNELLAGLEDPNNALSLMIDASHNLKDPLEDLLQSVEAMCLAYAQSLLVDFKKLEDAQNNNDVTLAQEILQNAYRTDVRPLLAAARLKRGGALDPIAAYRSLNVRDQLITERGKSSVSIGTAV